MVADTLQIVKIKFRNIRITLNRINPGNRISDYKYNEYTDSNKTEIKDITLYAFVFIFNVRTINKIYEYIIVI